MCVLQAFWPRRGCVLYARTELQHTFSHRPQRSPQNCAISSQMSAGWLARHATSGLSRLISAELRDFLTELRGYSVQLSLRKARPWINPMPS